MIKTYLKRFLTIVSLIVLPLSICVFTQNYADNDSQRLMGFYQEKENSLDVVYIGASDVYNAFSPALAYKEYGYTSYPYAFGSANLLPTLIPAFAHCCLNSLLIRKPLNTY